MVIQDLRLVGADHPGEVGDLEMAVGTMAAGMAEYWKGEWWTMRW